MRCKHKAISKNMVNNSWYCQECFVTVNDDHTDIMSRDLKLLINLLEKHCDVITLVSYGLAPNPNGFSYELYGDIPADEVKDIVRIDKLLDGLNKHDEEILKDMYLRG